MAEIKKRQFRRPRGWGRARHPETGVLLHFSGRGPAEVEHLSWSGTPDQYAALIKQYPESAAFEFEEAE